MFSNQPTLFLLLISTAAIFVLSYPLKNRNSHLVLVTDFYGILPNGVQEPAISGFGRRSESERLSSRALGNASAETNGTLNSDNNGISVVYQIYLACPDLCPKYNKQMHKWKRELNGEFSKYNITFDVRNLSGSYLNICKEGVPCVELCINASTSNPGKKGGSDSCHGYNGDANNKEDFFNFVRRLRENATEMPQDSATELTTWQQFESLLNDAQRSDGVRRNILFYDKKRCGISTYDELRQKFREANNITFNKRQWPLPMGMQLDIENRLHRSPLPQCHLLIIQDGSFLWLPVSTKTAEIISHINDTNYKRKYTSLWEKIGEPLTEIERTFYMEEGLSQEFVWKRNCILVGVTGGLAVIALAVSIFWGLNGSSFAAAK